MPPTQKIAYIASHSAVWSVLEGGFVALSPGLVDQPIVLREVGQNSMEGLDGQAVILFEIPAELLSAFERPNEGGGPGRSFAVPASIADRFPALAYRAEGPTASCGPPEAAEARRAKPPSVRPPMRRPLLPGRLRRQASPRSPAVTGLTVLALVGAGGTLYLLTSDRLRDDPQKPSPAARTRDIQPAGRTEAPPDRDAAPLREARRLARRSRAVGSPTDGSLLNGVPVPGEGKNFFTWNLPRGTSPNPRFRRFGTSTIVRRTRAVIADFRRANPRAPRVGIADLSLPEGGEFGVSFGGTGHVAHRNGTEVDILYPRRDRAEQATESPAEVDRRLAQDLLDRFLEVGAVRVVVDARVGLTGPARKIASAPFHEDHMHIRFPAR